jgi:hypothetical protein
LAASPSGDRDVVEMPAFSDELCDFRTGNQVRDPDRQAGRARAAGAGAGLVCNSGNSTGPHLHFQVAASAGLNAHGLPFVLESSSWWRWFRSVS